MVATVFGILDYFGASVKGFTAKLASSEALHMQDDALVQHSRDERIANGLLLVSPLVRL